jgi:non-ribosomal peptide synthase protein (TIGR01720 family)
LRAVYSELADGSRRLLLVAHHLGVDGVSWRILLQELQQTYRRLCEGQEPSFPAPSCNYREWAEGLRRYAGHPRLTSEVPYWLAQTEPAGLVDLPRDNPRGLGRVAHREQVQWSLSAEQTERLLKMAPEAYRTQINDLLLTALSRTLCRWCDSPAVLVGLEGHGREDLFDNLDHSRTLGWFTSLFPLRLTPGEGGYAETIPAVRDQVRALPDRGIGYGVLRYLGDESIRRRLAERAQPRVIFNYLGQFDQGFDEQALFAPLSEIVGQVYDGLLTLRCVFSRRVYRRSTIEQLMAGLRDELQAVIDHCCTRLGERQGQTCLPA